MELHETTTGYTVFYRADASYLERFASPQSYRSHSYWPVAGSVMSA